MSPSPTPIRLRYAILSSPRSGSTLLGRMLTATNMVGNPQEYFSRNMLVQQREKLRKPALSALQLLSLMEPLHTSPNGVFGLKMHYQQFLSAYQTDFVDDAMRRFLRAQHHLIWIRRQDRLRQAVSYAIAIKSNVWSTAQPATAPAPVIPLDLPHLLECLRDVCLNDLAWENLIQTEKLTAHAVWYEDLVTNYEAVSRAALRHLNLDQQIAKIPPQPIARQSDARNEELYHALCDYLGCPPNPINGTIP